MKLGSQRQPLLRQLRQRAGELEQQLESLALLDGEELLADLVEGPAHDAGTSPGSRPFTIGTRTALPHSVQEPS